MGYIGRNENRTIKVFGQYEILLLLLLAFFIGP